MSEELKPCAHCGEPAGRQVIDANVFAGQDYGDRYPDDVRRQSHGFKIRCECCAMQTCWWHYAAEAIEAWNRRAGGDDG